MWRFILLLMFVSPLGWLVWPAQGEAAGPWKAQVVDVETGQPLQGVVVLAVWERRTPGPGHPTIRFYDANEVLTGPDGHFVVPSRRIWTLLPFTSIEGPKIFIFKSGYGRWRFRGEEEWQKLDVRERNLRYEEAWRQFEGEGIVLELPPLKTREERLRFLGHANPLIPDDKMSRYLEALSQERVSLGLTP